MSGGRALAARWAPARARRARDTRWAVAPPPRPAAAARRQLAAPPPRGANGWAGSSLRAQLGPGVRLRLCEAQAEG